GFGQVEPARGRVERREQPVLGERPGAGQRVEQRRLPGVGVAHERNGERPTALPRAALHLAAALELAELVLEHLDARGDEAPVDLELGLAHPRQESLAAALALEVRPAAYQPRRSVLELRELDLQLP